jgi:hypothetical protein
MNLYLAQGEYPRRNAYSVLSRAVSDSAKNIRSEYAQLILSYILKKKLPKGSSF